MPDGVHEELHQEKVIDVLRVAVTLSGSGEVSRSVLCRNLHTLRRACSEEGGALSS